MKTDIRELMHKLSSKSIMERKQAIKHLKRMSCDTDGYMAVLCLHYVAIHDPCYTVRNLARQACYKFGELPQDMHSWERTYLF